MQIGARGARVLEGIDGQSFLDLRQDVASTRSPVGPEISAAFGGHLRRVNGELNG